MPEHPSVQDRRRPGLLDAGFAAAALALGAADRWLGASHEQGATAEPAGDHQRILRGQPAVEPLPARTSRCSTRTAVGMLESIEYEDINHRTLPVVGQDAHGSLSLRGLPNGTWIVEEWSIALPHVAEARDNDGRARRYDLLGYVEEGGFVTEVARGDGMLVARPGQPGIRGTVTDSLDRPAAGARVWIDGTVREAVTDEVGSFLIDDLGWGVWSVRVTHPELRAWGHRGEVVDVTVEELDSDRVRVQLPSVTTLAQNACDVAAESGMANALGRVIDLRGEPVAGAVIRARWTEETDSGRAEVRGLGDESDAEGVFRLCSVPTDTPVLVSARTPHASGSTDTSMATFSNSAWAISERCSYTGSSSRRTCLPSRSSREVGHLSAPRIPAGPSCFG